MYLLLIALMDARSVGHYFNHAIFWQRGESRPSGPLRHIWRSGVKWASARTHGCVGGWVRGRAEWRGFDTFPGGKFLKFWIFCKCVGAKIALVLLVMTFFRTEKKTRVLLSRSETLVLSTVDGRGYQKNEHWASCAPRQNLQSEFRPGSQRDFTRNRSSFWTLYD